MNPHLTPSNIEGFTQRLKRLGITQQELSEALCVSQSQISRDLGGKSSSRPQLLRKICNNASFSESAVTVERVCANDELIGALTDNWDGSLDHAHSLATVIRAPGAMSRPALFTRRRAT